MWWKFFSFIVILAAKSVMRLRLFARASAPAAFVGSVGLFAAVLAAAGPGDSRPDPAAPRDTEAQVPLHSDGTAASFSPWPPVSAVSYLPDSRARVEEVGRKLEALLQWYCFNCIECEDGHQLTGEDREGVVGFHPEACTQGPCSQHPACGISDEIVGESKDVLSATLESLTAAAPGELVALASAFPHVVRINRDRRALQLVGCGDQIVASWSATSIPALEEVLE